ncbi:hypothetical protein LTR37_020640 [Vermiconidia calcicola]|uniref:Uncharacterized protein n=1 Tax=Vermiconidia calcicola TaxID=1690605 RepID=A0ACC3MAT2_9PEZI|nr:hypothetical protein LTR37_020640 [Vermiconidia calcicola]
MPPKKKGTKRKATPQANGSEITNGDSTPAPPDRTTWPGWVEMESEPAFFNIMLNEMGARGVKVQEVYGLDEEMLATLPQPVHALIFLFRYRDTYEAQQEKGTKCPNHVWFANQVPDFACASVALLNIVNNIEGLQMGKELRDFRDFTRGMDPLGRGDAIDSFEFVKHIHNSFARENDLLIADMAFKQKAARAKKRQAITKARESRKMQKDVKAPLNERSLNVKTTPTRLSSRPLRKAPKGGSTGPCDSSPLSDPPESDPEYENTPGKLKKSASKSNATRRSARKPQPRKDTFAASAAAEVDDEDGFHFIAYMPIQGHVWKLDGLDSFPHDLGGVDATSGGDWMSIAQPALQMRMAMYEGADIEFNLMAVVHDPALKDRDELLRNAKELQAVEKRLDCVFEDWRSLDGAETMKEVITSSSTDFDISQADIDGTGLVESTSRKIEEEEDLLGLIEMRKQVICRQRSLRASIRDASEGAKGDEQKSKHRRHNYGGFVKSWFGALAENELLSELLEAA